MKKHSNKNRTAPSSKDSYLDETIDVPSFVEQPVKGLEVNKSNSSIINKMFEESVVVDLSTAKANWYFGEWQALVDLDIQALSNHQDVDKLAALKASAYQQLNDMEQSKAYFQLARELGCENQLISQLLIAGVHNSLGKVSALKNDDDKMLMHFDEAVNVGNNSQENKLARQARSITEMSKLGLLPQIDNILESKKANPAPRISVGKETTDSLLINKLQAKNHELSEELKKITSLFQEEQNKIDHYTERLEAHIIALDERTRQRDEQVLLVASLKQENEELACKLTNMGSQKEQTTAAFKLMERDLNSLQVKYSKLLGKANTPTNKGLT